MHTNETRAENGGAEPDQMTSSIVHTQRALAEMEIEWREGAFLTADITPCSYITSKSEIMAQNNDRVASSLQWWCSSPHANKVAVEEFREWLYETSSPRHSDTDDCRESKCDVAEDDMRTESPDRPLLIRRQRSKKLRNSSRSKWPLDHPCSRRSLFAEDVQTRSDCDHGLPASILDIVPNSQIQHAMDTITTKCSQIVDRNYFDEVLPPPEFAYHLARPVLDSLKAQAIFMRDQARQPSRLSWRKRLSRALRSSRMTAGDEAFVADVIRRHESAWRLKYAAKVVVPYLDAVQKRKQLDCMMMDSLRQWQAQPEDSFKVQSPQSLM